MKRLFNNLSLRGLLPLMAVFLCLIGGTGQAWATSGNTAVMRGISKAPANGLVYVQSKATAPSDADLHSKAVEVTSELSVDGSAAYIWAVPARGWKWKSWSSEGYKEENEVILAGLNSISIVANSGSGSATGSGDKVTGSKSTIQSNASQFIANWVGETAYSVVYNANKYGPYTVSYQYWLIENGKFSHKSEPISLTEEDARTIGAKMKTPESGISYATDEVTLSTTAANFIEWQEDGVRKSTEKTYRYQVNKGATISALFRGATLETPTGNVKKTVYSIEGHNLSVSIPVVDVVGDGWTKDNFTVSFTKTKGTATVTKGDVDYASGTLTIPYVYTPSEWGGTIVHVEITPSNATAICNTLEFDLVLEAKEPSADVYEACIYNGGVTPAYTGTLAEMIEQANNMDSKPTLQLNSDVTISTPLSFTKSMTFDINSYVLTSTGVAAFSVDAAGIDVKVEDKSFAQNGIIRVNKDYNGITSVVTFTKAAKLTLEGGNMSATNKADVASNANAKAYGIYVSNGSMFYQTGGKLSVTSDKNATGVYVATAADYVTLNGGAEPAQLIVSGKSNVYGVWSAGQANITKANMTVDASIGSDAYGVYVNGGSATFNTVDAAISAKTTKAYGAYVAAGRLNFSAGSLNVTSATSDAYGVYVAKSATANILMGTTIMAEATAGGTVRGIHNLGTAVIKNANVSAVAATTNAVAVNSETSTTRTSIEDGTYTASATGGTVYGLHHQYGALDVDGGSFKGIALNGSTAYGARATVNVTIRNAEMWGETFGIGNTAYGFVGGTADKTMNLINCAITANSATSKAYAIYSRTNVTATNCKLAAHTKNGNVAVGFYAENGTNVLINDTANVRSYSTDAFGVNHAGGSMTIKGGKYSVLAQQVTATAAQDAALYGVKNAKSCTATISDAEFNVEGTNGSYGQKGFGLYASGTVNISNSTFNSIMRAYAYGVYGDGSSNMTLSHNTVNSETNVASESYGIYSNKTFSIKDDNVVEAISKTTNAYCMNFGASAVGMVSDGHFKASGTLAYGPITRTATVGNVQLEGGYYATPANADYYLATDYSVFALDDDDDEYKKGYRYIVAEQNPSLYVCKIGTTEYRTLEAAMQYAIDNSSKDYLIIMTQPYTLPAGDYVLPSNATLLVPYSKDQTAIAGANVIKRKNQGVIEENLRLTFASGVNMSVDGSIEVGGEMYCVEGVASTAYVQSSYGRLHLEDGVNIVLNNGAKLYAWGYVTGSGNIKAKSGSVVYEMFQLHDMKGYGALTDYYLANKQSNSPKIFPINQYFVQNVEAPVTYYYNSQLITAMYMYYRGTTSYMGDGAIKMIGTSDALFQITTNDESSWVRKSYDPSKDLQVWDINSSAKLGSLSISVSGVSMNSSDYVLPITNNMKLHVLDGNMELTQSTQFQPGSQLEIDKTANMKVNSGCTLYMIDQSEWGSYASSAAAKKVVYSPSWNKGTCPRGLNLADQADAALNVHGTLTVAGTLRTTASGANIYSNNDDAGTITFTANAPTTETNNANLYFFSGTAATPKNTTAAQLKNATGYTQTVNAESEHSFVYMNNAWVESYVDGCFKVIGTTYYANPSEYVALQNGKTANDDHTYTTVGGKTLILQNDCQWWEVEATATPGVFECKKEGYEGFYSYNTTAGEWQLVKRTVTFYSDEAGTKVLKTVVTNYMGIPDQSVIANNPTKATTAEATYQFSGWKSSVAPNKEYAWTATLEPAATDMSYTPVFTETPRNYTVTMKDALNGADVPVETGYGHYPDFEARKDADAQYSYNFLYWRDAAGNTYATCAELPVVNSTNGLTPTYTAIWEPVNILYTITWKDGDKVLEVDKNQVYDAKTSFNGTLPTKEADNEFEYAFDGWQTSPTSVVIANGSTPAVKGDVTYTAHFATTPRYMISFVNFDGTELQKEPVTKNVVPVFSGTPRRDADRDGYYKFTGWMNSAGTLYAVGATLPAATKKETYTAQWEYVTTVYTITFKNFDGNAASTWSNRFGEGETPSYDGATPLGKPATASKEYTLDYWVATSNSEHYTDPLPAVSKAETYTAHFAESARLYTITWKDGNGEILKKEDVAYGNTPAYVGATPTQASTATKEYAFNGSWKPAITSVSGDATYTALFNESDIKFTITWLDGDGQIIKEERVTVGQTPEYTGATPTKTSSADNDFIFNGTWSPAIVAVSDDAVYRAQFNAKARTFNVVFKDWDGSEIKSSELAYNAKPTVTDPVREAVLPTMYTFTGWKSSLDSRTYTTANLPNATADVIYTAQYSSATAAATVTTTGGDVTPYTSFTAALTAAKASAGSTLKLYAPVTGYGYTINSSMTLDFNGYTITGTWANENSQIFTITGNPVVFQDSSNGNGGLSATCSRYNQSAKAIVVNGGNLTINGGKYSANHTYTTNTNNNRYPLAYTITHTSGTLVINGGEFTATTNNSVTNSKTSTINNTAAVTIYGGKFKASGNKGTINNLSTNNMCSATGGYFTHNANVVGAMIDGVIAYGCVSSSEVSGYSYKVQKNQYDIIFKNGDDVLQNTKVEHGSMPEYVGEEPQKEGYTFNGWDKTIVVATAKATYAAQWKVNQYTVSWDANGGVLSGDYINGSVDYGTTIEAPTAKKDGYNFAGWSPEVPSTVTDNLSFTASWTEVPLTEDIVADEVVEISENTKVNNLTISENGSVTIDDAAAVTVVSNLYLEATPDDNLGAVLSGNVQVQGDAYIDINMNGSGTMNKNYYYSFAVPFSVDLNGGVFRMEGGNAVLAKPNTEFRVWTYSEAKRAEGKSDATWIQQTSGTLVPGVFYLLQVATNNTNTYRFKWNHTGNLNNHNNISVSKTEVSGGEGAASGWNGIANNGLNYTTMTGAFSVIQTLNSSENKFVDLDEPLAMAKPVFVQVAANGTVTLASVPASVAARRAQASEERSMLRLQITKEGESKRADQVYFSASSEAIDEYETGKDVAKMFMGTAKTAQMWINAYDNRLIANEAVMVNNRADFELTMFAPAAADYELNLRDLPSDAQVVLLYNGAPVADLTLMPYYSLSLAQGETTDYSIAIIRKTPSVTTGTEQMEKTQTEVQKIFFDGKLYIVTGEHVYDAQGKLVK